METTQQTCYRHPDQLAGIVCQRCDRPICPQCMHQASVGFHCPDCTKSGAQKVYSGPSAFVSRPVLTQVLIGLNLLVFIVVVVVGGAGALQGQTTQLHIDLGLLAKLWERGDDLFIGPVAGSTEIGVGAGQVYRMVTSAFLHYGVIHIAFNMYVLWVLGTVLENAAGRLRFALIFATSVLAGSLLALVLTPDAITAGASGGVFGIMGAMFLVYRANGIPFRNSPLLSLLVLNLVITFVVPSISKGGHIGGLLGGALAGWLFFDLARRPGMDRRIPVAICAVVLVALAVGGYVFAAGYTPTS